MTVHTAPLVWPACDHCGAELIDIARPTAEAAIEIAVREHHWEHWPESGLLICDVDLYDYDAEGNCLLDCIEPVVIDSIPESIAEGEAEPVQFIFADPEGYRLEIGALADGTRCARVVAPWGHYFSVDIPGGLVIQDRSGARLSVFMDAPRAQN
ncbi:hypothetical protein [Nocardia sp. XZ_19_231]|uniref:hypothetical protein n=1 Tax=Nocardia sp. XZ_19_231 TaxID=2769252 RepID=UPI00188F65CF|nr:hypothetical protein [Nocardia sp. XZ_19_231]